MIQFHDAVFETGLTPPMAAVILNVSERWLSRRRHSGSPPRFIRDGKTVRYPESALREFLSTGDPAIAKGQARNKEVRHAA